MIFHSTLLNSAHQSFVEENGHLIKKKRDDFSIIPLSGAEGNRTPVQTYPSKAFYMFISLLIVGGTPGMNKPIYHLAVWS